MKRLGDVKNPKVPLRGARSGRVLFRYSEIELYPRAKFSYFQNSVIMNYNAMEDETLHQELPPHKYARTHAYIFTDLKRQFFHLFIP